MKKCFCGKVFRNKKLMEIHLIEHHYINGDVAPSLASYMEDMIPRAKIKAKIKELEEKEEKFAMGGELVDAGYVNEIIIVLKELLN